MKIWSVLIVSVFLTQGVCMPAYAGGKRALLGAAVERVLARDAARDAARMAQARGLDQSTQVWRYTSRAQADKALKQGLPAGAHYTPGTHAGRLPKAATAQRQYGLPHRPDVRLTVQLPEGQRVIRNKALGGQPGRGELVTRDAVPASAISRVQPLR